MFQFFTVIFLASLWRHSVFKGSNPPPLFCKVYRFQQEWNYHMNRAASKPLESLVTFKTCSEPQNCIVASRIVGTGHIRRHEYFHDCLSNVNAADYGTPDCIQQPHNFTLNFSYSCCAVYRCHLEYPLFKPN